MTLRIISGNILDMTKLNSLSNKKVLTPAHEDYLKAKAKIEKEIGEFEDQEIAKFRADLRQNVGDYLLATH
ncbi:MAG TPA: hypothetical protein PKE45_24325, partial [Caldilineaceae bacterium]|nr:hypothetical protein [Caldilineaceae bacterium]